MRSHFTFYNHLLLKVQNPLSERLSAGSSHKKHELQSHVLKLEQTINYRSYAVAQRCSLPPPTSLLTPRKDHNLKPRSRTRFGKEIHLVANPGRIIWDLTSGGFALQRLFYKIVLAHMLMCARVELDRQWNKKCTHC